MIGILLAAAIGLAPQDVVAPAAPTAPQEPVALEDVVVTGRPLEQMIRNFVGEVAAPNRDRGLARWRDRICVGVVNLKTESAEYIADRVSTVADDLGIAVGAPGCTPNILVVATTDGEELAQGLVGERPRAFRMGGTGMDQGGAALRRFQAGERPVRWWQMAMPVDSETGQRAVRIPGECTGACMNSSDFAPTLTPFTASRLHTQIIDNLSRSIVILDVSKLPDDLTILQLSDFIAMITLAQIDPEADTSPYASILNVFDNSGSADSLTTWDLAYLEGLYNAESGAANRRAGRSEVSRSIARAHGRIRDAEADAELEPAAQPDSAGE